MSIYDTEQSTTGDAKGANAQATQGQLDYYNANGGQGLTQQDLDRIYARAYNTYAVGGPMGYQGSGLFNPNSALFGGSAAASAEAAGDIQQTTQKAIGASNAGVAQAEQRAAQSGQYGTQQTNAANTLLSGASNDLTGLAMQSGALGIRGAARPGTEGLQMQANTGAQLQGFAPEYSGARDALAAESARNAAAVRSLALSGRGSGVNASAQQQGNASAANVMANDALQQQQLAVQEYQSNQALRMQALQGAGALGASQQQGATGNAQFALTQQQAAAAANMAAAGTAANNAGAAQQYQAQAANNRLTNASQQQQLAGQAADIYQTSGQANANYLGAAQQQTNNQLSTEAQLRSQGIINAAQTKAGLANTNLALQTQANIANQAADTAMLGSMLSTGAGAVGAYTDSKEKDQW